MVSLEQALASASTRAGRFVSRHPRALTALVTATLAGFGAAAFGIAPMTASPDVSTLPKRLITETIQPDGLQTQLDALADQELALYRSDLTRASDTVDTLLRRLNVDDAAASIFLRNDATARKLLEGRSGKMIQVRTDGNGDLQELIARFPAANPDQANTHFSRLRVHRVAGRLQASLETAPLASQVRLGSGTVRSSLFAATDDARMPDAIATQLAEVFSGDIDFHRELRRGDTFSVVYETLTADGEPITWNASAGRVVAAEFVNNGRSYSAVWFKDAQGKGGYFGLDGRSKHRSFLASPMEFSRITSGFAMRLHPILNQWKQHNGTDYGAPMGTPVRTVGDGVVDFAGWQNGYGNVVQIKHSNNRATVYAHLSRIDVKRGQHVDQGARIGAVGATGWATGPHLHFEFKVAGLHQDPTVMAKASETIAIGNESRAQFAQMATSLKSQLEAAESLARSGAYAE